METAHCEVNCRFDAIQRLTQHRAISKRRANGRAHRHKYGWHRHNRCKSLAMPRAPGHVPRRPERAAPLVVAAALCGFTRDRATRGRTRARPAAPSGPAASRGPIKGSRAVVASLSAASGPRPAGTQGLALILDTLGDRWPGTLAEAS